ncbi:glycosyltransferase family 2 protein [Rhizobiales bacterium]|uniref:glycosyltransferase family 2 protein n=1 Tax=Hongsoonwoonella zoysiae TaxID=2821844 RepID=UPI0015607678|nr:glycosyltransferase family 2 protein [Hongsoonwoonella zoysiae]NRG18491.1 glycosyltransferase family 2 protein [Hongsoonwoonella zoysiae]
MNKPHVSYIVPVYNKQEYLSELVESIIAQVPYKTKQICFADDASTDGSVEVLKYIAEKYSKFENLDINIACSLRNKGPAAATNLALSKATGDYFHFVDADDRLPEGATAAMIKASELSGAEIVYGGKAHFSSGKLSGGSKVALNGEFKTFAPALPALVRGRLVGIRFLAKAGAVVAANGADERIFIQDVSLPLRVAAASSSLAVLEAVVVEVRDAENSVSSNKAQELHDYLMAVRNFLSEGEANRSVRGRLLRRCYQRIARRRKSEGVAAFAIRMAWIGASLGWVSNDPLKHLEEECARLAASGNVRIPDSETASAAPVEAAG